MIKRRWLLAALVAAAAVACAPRPATRPELAPASAATAAVAMPDSYSADTAAQVLKTGGNAVDAAVASAFVLAVTLPEAGNIGGGGFMLAYVDGKPAFLDYREVAPAAATRDMYLDARGEVVPDLSLTSHRAAGVPGTVAGLWAAHKRYGSRPWSDLLAPAIRFADEGFVVHPQLEQFVREDLPRMHGKTNFERYYGALRSGEVFRQPELAAVLRRIAAEGQDDFYRGRTAELITAEMQRGGGLVTAADLAAYRPIWREPLRARWRGFEILGAPPPSSGGFAIIQLLKMKDVLAPAFEGLAHNSAPYVHLVAEMEKRVFADRAEYFGDPAFVAVPVGRLLDDRYIAARAGEVNRGGISPVASVKPGLEPQHTTHFSIVDRQGNAVANTYTLNTSFGSGVVVEDGGFLLNNEMDDFSLKPGTPNYYGVVGSTANEIQPGKRMLSSMSPTILLDEGRAAMVLGSPGGSTIISSVFETIVNVADFHMTPAQAVGATRVHHQLLPPERVTYSPSRPLPAATIEELKTMGYDPQPHEWEFGDVQLITWDGAAYAAASDPRGRGVSLVLRP